MINEFCINAFAALCCICFNKLVSFKTSVRVIYSRLCSSKNEKGDTCAAHRNTDNVVLLISQFWFLQL